MAIITLAQYKTLLGITSTDATRDARLTALIPQVEADIVEICNNQFTNDSISFSGSFVPTVSAGPVYTLVCSAGGITDEDFADGDTILLEGTVRNDGRYTATTFAATTVTVSEAVVAESAVTSSITLVQFPAGIRIYAARMLKYLYDHITDGGLQSETIDNYSYTRATGPADNGYPSEIIRGLAKWTNVRTGRGTKMTQYRDKRGGWVSVKNE